MPSLPTSYESDDPTASDSKTSYNPRSPTSPLSPLGEPISIPQDPPAETTYDSPTMLYYILNKIDEMSQQGGVRAAAINEVHAACHNRIDELERRVARLQNRSEVQAIRIRSSQMTNIPPANELRQEMTAALTDQAQILRDLLVQLQALTRSTLRAPDVTTEENTPTTECTNRRRNNRNPERRN
ncbi:hypothetical protein F2Q69_00034134 [Brassica cretica]|uniref:Uncharacterized protein n=1 Tax=Brassica cretica TaxID=69181 RepID=A0A8S9SS30_BRACR|nr:hypothetical protein F2Q69_00034134 [Brassica cretica]